MAECDVSNGVSIRDCFPIADSFPTLSSLVNVLLNNALTIAGVIAFVAVVITGLKIIQSAGDAKAQEQSKGAFTAAVIGLIIIIGAYFILQIAETLLGYPILNPLIGQ